MDRIGDLLDEVAERFRDGINLVSRKRLSSIVNGHAGISPELAIRLDRVFGGGAAPWHQLQAAYALAQAVKKAAGLYEAQIG